jgi:hypothetical protein
MGQQPSMDDYIDVNERIQDFKDAFPDGSLQQYAAPYPITLTGTSSKRGEEGIEQTATFIVYTAAAYRTPDDPRPGIGTAYERFPGPTPYTHDSELMNAETAAWGRAIVALGLTANRHLASRQEVRARQESQNQPEPDASTPAVPAPKPSNKPIGPELVAAISEAYKKTGWKDEKAEDPHAILRMTLLTIGAPKTDGSIAECIKALNAAQADKLRAEFKKPAEQS